MKVSNLVCIFSILLVSFNVNAESIEQSRQQISESLNQSVKYLKDKYAATNIDLNSTNTSSKDLKEKAKILSDRSKEDEINPNVLKHGQADIIKCDPNELLAWDGVKWICQSAAAFAECSAPAPDEYIYELNGNNVCSKSAKGQSLNYYWKFRDYSTCINMQQGLNKLYSCVYKNKKNKEVQVADSYCKSAKPSVAKKACSAQWKPLNWSVCSAKCGKGTQTRHYTCPTGYTCEGNAPVDTQECTHTSPECNVCKYDRNNLIYSAGGFGGPYLDAWREVGFIINGKKHAYSYNFNTTRTINGQVYKPGRVRSNQNVFNIKFKHGSSKLGPYEGASFFEICKG